MGRALGDIHMRRSSGTVFRGALQVAVLVVLSVPTNLLLADTTLNSGTTTVSTGTNFGTRLYVASTGIATMNVIAGGYATDSIGYLGYSAGSLGSATVSSGTWANGSSLIIGASGRGTLNVTGGKVTNTYGTLGSAAGGVGTAIVSSGTWASSIDFDVGVLGTGTLSVTGGIVTNADAVLGVSSYGSGAATVSSGTWASSGNLTVGSQGTGTLNINGGSVTNGIGYVASSYNIGGSSIGNVSVSSGTWANRGSLYVGVEGIGAMAVTGGSVTNVTCYIGGAPDGGGSGNGSVTVSGGTWANSGNLNVGSGGVGTLTMSGGLVTVAGSVNRNSSSTINLNAGGTLQIGVGSTGGDLLGGTGSLANNGALVFSRSDASTHSGVISGTGSVTKQGAGTLTLSGNNTYTGGTKINGGVLALGIPNAVSTSGAITFGGGTLQYSASNTTDYSSRFSTVASQAYEIDTNGQNVTLASPLSSSGGTLTKFGAGTLTLSASNSYTGGTTIVAGTLQVGSGGTTGSIAGNVVNDAFLAFNRSNSSTFSGVISGTGTLTKKGAGTLTLSGNNSYTGGTTISGGIIALGNANALGVAGSVTMTSGTLDLNGQSVTLGAISGSSGGTITTGAAGSVTLASMTVTNSTYAGAIVDGAGTIALMKQATGTLTLTGSNSYSGGTTISDGVLALESASALGTSGTISFGGGTLQYSVSNTTDYSSRFSTAANQAYEIDTNGQNVTLASPLASSGGTLTKLGSGTLTLTGNNTYTGGTNLFAGVLAVSGKSALGTGPLSLNGGALIAAAGGGSFANAVLLNANTTISGSDALTIGGDVTLNGFNTVTFTNTAQTTIGGQIGESSPSILIKQGNGELQLTGASSYTGGTFVQSGTVRINNSSGSAFGAGAVTVASGATLTGAGSISGAVQMNGTWAPGNSPGLVTVNSNVVLGGSLDMELGGVLRATSGTGGGGYYDAMNVSNALALGGTLKVVFSNGFIPSYGDSFTLLQAAALSGDFGTVIYPALSDGLSWERTTSATAMTITVVPEPSTFAISALATAGLAGLMRWRRRPGPCLS
jgi:autotransporter-associated beta strand protein/T5SS/PEP-CTERM-associated repeat protein